MPTPMLSRVLFPGDVRPMTRWLLRLIACHSCGLGAVMLFASGPFLRVMGFPPSTSSFLPSQSGVFLVILGVCYLLAASEPALVSVVILSKAAAVVFLVIHVAFLGAPPAIWGAAAGDGAMLVAVLMAPRFEEWRQRG